MTIEYDPTETLRKNSGEGAGGGGDGPIGEDLYEGPYRVLREGEEVALEDVSQNTVTREPMVPIRKYGK
ncbi:hypothetical protein HY948_01020 [Candidatus Gottesmanbacteria bacterium]|nr:hypothetical protein [Candidatus Gottesmanbacteria bacterium]